jgi:hypothetical protein
VGQIIKANEHYEYQQDDGKITAWFPHMEEKMELSHESIPAYKIIFYILIGLGFLYLSMVFTFVH